MSNNNFIHHTALVDPKVQLGAGNYIGPYCIVSGEVQLGNHNYLIGHVNINSKVEIGDHNVFYSHVSIGQPGEMGAKGDRMVVNGKTKVGNHNTFRENVCVHAPIYYEATIIQNHCYLMNGSYVAHDGHLENHVNLTAGVKLAGRVKVESHANLGLNATVHQRCIIGESAMVGMLAAVNKSVPPFAVVAGNPCRILKCNLIGAERRGFPSNEVEQLAHSYKQSFNTSFHIKNSIIQKVQHFLSTHNEVLTQFKSQ